VEELNHQLLANVLVIQDRVLGVKVLQDFEESGRSEVEKDRPPELPVTGPVGGNDLRQCPVALRQPDIKSVARARQEFQLILG
jgi:hypothetical protein